jgi:hypothetical protein
MKAPEATIIGLTADELASFTDRQVAGTRAWLRRILCPVRCRSRGPVDLRVLRNWARLVHKARRRVALRRRWHVVGTWLSAAKRAGRE